MDFVYYSGEEALQVFGSFVSGSGKQWSKVICLCDTNTNTLCKPVLESCGVRIDRTIVIGAGERHKDLHTLSTVWHELLLSGADRNSLLINLGGGVVTDLGGMAASTFMRGISFVNIPTTLLCMVDASIGGKTGIDFGGAKNIAGTFALPELTVSHFPFLDTLPDQEWKNGFAEMIKHQLVGDAIAWEETTGFFSGNPFHAEVKDFFRQRIPASAAIKFGIVQKDPLEKNIRACLNFGHTIGHGMEAWSLDHEGEPIQHGEAVAAGTKEEQDVNRKKVRGEKPGRRSNMTVACKGLGFVLLWLDQLHLDLFSFFLTQAF